MTARSHHTRRNWPTNLHGRTVKGKVYYTYRDPQTRKETGLGTDLTAAKRAALILNEKRMADPVMQLVNRVEKPRAMFHATVDAWEAFWLADTRPSESHAKNTRWRLGKIKKHVPDKNVALVEQFDLGKFLDDHISPAGSNRYRDLLEHVMGFAVAKGYRPDNPASGLLKRAKAPRKRARLDVDQYEQLHKAASPHMKIVMDLIRLSLQRPGDLVRLDVSAWDGRTLLIQQGKTGTRLAITAHAALRNAINAAVKYRISDCTALLCYDAPKRAINHRSTKLYKRHWAQPTEELLTREFTALFRMLYPKIDPRPTLYECKSLGAAQYEALGWPRERIQALAGHSEISTTAIYTAGHTHYTPVDLTKK